MLLLFITFLFINTEVWQVSSALSRPVLWLSVAFFGALAVVFLVVRLPEEVAAVNDDLDPDVVRRAVRGTPLEPHLDDLDDVHAEPLDRRQRTNLLLVLLVTQASQVLLLSLSVWVFFLVFGRVAIDESVITTWVGNGAPHYPLLLGRLGVSRELLQVSIFLAAFSGLYFTVYAVTDSTYREQFFHEITHELERAVGVRAAYLALRRRCLRWPPWSTGPSAVSGAVVSTYALGTMTFGNETDEEGSHEQLDVFLEAGGTLVDTADVYTAGASEEIVGRWLDDRPVGRDRPGGARHQGAVRDGGGPQRRRAVPPAPDPRAGRLAAPAAGGLRRPLPGARLGPAHPGRGDPRLLRRRGPRREGPLRRAVELHRLAGAEGPSTSRSTAACRGR